MSTLNYQLPLNFSEQLVDSTKLGGYAYVRGMPELLNLVKNHAAAADRGVSAANTIIYPGLGPQRMYTSCGKSWLSGTNLICCDLATTNYVACILRVISYDPRLGLLWFENQYQNAFADRLLTTWSLSSFNGEYAISSNTIAAGLTSGVETLSLRAGLQLASAKDYSILFDDFIGSHLALALTTTGNTNISGQLAGAGLSNLMSTGISGTQLDVLGHPGTAQLSLAANTIQAQLLTFGPSGAFDAMDWSGAADVFEACIHMPTLPVAANFSISVGMISSNAAAGPNAFVYYNGGNFSLRSGAQNALTTTAIAIAPVANAWNKIRVERSGANILFTIFNGATTVTGTVATTSLISLGTVRGTCGIQFLSPSSTAGIKILNCDYMYLRKQLNGHR